jgi:16S rRNA (cytosine1402-N4)-methyltransferase
MKETEVYHVPVLLNESIEALNIRPDGIYADLTFGGGGHSKVILEKLGSSGRLVVFDQDEDALKNLPPDSRVVAVHHNFRFLKHFLEYHQTLPIDGLLADLGVSSHQFDEAKRGFSFREDGPLDMRMSRGISRTAADLLQVASEQELKYIFGAYGEIDHPGKLVREIVNYRKQSTFRLISDLLQVMETCIPRQGASKFKAQVFQALRIEVNQELKALEEMLLQLPEVVRPGGRIAIMSYHSLEDRLVKHFIQTGNLKGERKSDEFGRLDTPFRAVAPKLIQPSEEEILRNPRSRSARLRIAERI